MRAYDAIQLPLVIVWVATQAIKHTPERLLLFNVYLADASRISDEGPASTQVPACCHG